MGPTPGLYVALLFTPGVTSGQACLLTYHTGQLLETWREASQVPHCTRCGLSSSQGHRPYTADPGKPLASLQTFSFCPGCSYARVLPVSLTRQAHLQIPKYMVSLSLPWFCSQPKYHRHWEAFSRLLARQTSRVYLRPMSQPTGESS